MKKGPMKLRRVSHLIMRKGGAHQKSNGAVRKLERQELPNKIHEEDE